MERIELRYQPVEPRGCVHLYKESDGTYTIEHKDLYQVYSRVDGLTIREARAEYKIWSAR